jgi:hypothetical protein
MNHLRLWGCSLIGVCVFKLAITPLVGVPPDPVNVTITLTALALGGLLIFWSLTTFNQRPQADNQSRNVGRDPLRGGTSETRK